MPQSDKVIEYVDHLVLIVADKAKKTIVEKGKATVKRSSDSFLTDLLHRKQNIAP